MYARELQKGANIRKSSRLVLLHGNAKRCINICSCISEKKRRKKDRSTVTVATREVTSLGQRRREIRKRGPFLAARERLSHLHNWLFFDGGDKPVVGYPRVQLASPLSRLARVRLLAGPPHRVARRRPGRIFNERFLSTLSTTNNGHREMAGRSCKKRRCTNPISRKNAPSTTT